MKYCHTDKQHYRSGQRGESSMALVITVIQQFTGNYGIEIHYPVSKRASTESRCRLTSNSEINEGQKKTGG